MDKYTKDQVKALIHTIWKDTLLSAKDLEIGSESYYNAVYTAKGLYEAYMLLDDDRYFLHRFNQFNEQNISDPPRVDGD